MLQIDVISAYVICGAGSLVGAAMMWLAQPDEQRLRQALRAFVWAFLALGVALFQLVAAGAQPPDSAMLVALEGTVLGLALCGIGFGHLGAKPLPTIPTAAVIGLSMLALAWAERAGERAYAIAFALTSTLFACVMAYVLRHAAWRPRNVAERVMGLSLIAHAASWLLRSAFTIAHDGPPLRHQLYVPESLVSAFGIYYCVMPIIVAALVLNVVNARLSQQLRSRAMTDELTGVMTRRALRELAPVMIDRAQLGGAQVAVLMLDLDHFKAINDQHGHRVGDEVLRHSATLITTNLRPDALLTRYGGEEFVVVAPVVDMRTARLVAERLRSAVASAPYRSEAAAIPVTISIGVTLLATGEALEPGLQRADDALYRAKREGRNRVETALAAALPSVPQLGPAQRDAQQRTTEARDTLPDSAPRSH